MDGWFKLHRELVEKPIWLNSTPEQKAILITILSMANFKPNKWEWNGEQFELKEGQFITSLESIASKAGKGISVQNVRTALNRFEKLKFLTNQSTKTGRLITIENWGIYQAEEDKPNKVSNKDLTKSQQRPNKDLTPNKESKKEKNVRNKESSHFVPPTLDEVRDYCMERENTVDAARFIDFYSAKGWMVGKNKMKDWRASVRTWERRDSENNSTNSKSKTSIVDEVE